MPVRTGKTFLPSFNRLNVELKQVFRYPHPVVGFPFNRPKVELKRVAKVCKYLRQHLNWVQNSVFEGGLTKAQLARVKSGLLGIIDESEDSVLIYQMRHEKWMDKQVIGIEKKSGDKPLYDKDTTRD